MNKILKFIVIFYGIVFISIGTYSQGIENNFYGEQNLSGASPYRVMKRVGTEVIPVTGGDDICLTAGGICLSSAGGATFTGTLNDVSDVSTTTTSYGELLMWTGSNWTNTATSSLGIVGSGGSMTYPGAGIALSTGAAWDTSITNNSANWNTAYSWGDWSGEGFITGMTWGELTGTQSDISLSGFTDDLSYLTNADINTYSELNTIVADQTLVYSGGAFHDGFSDFVANEHIDWTSDQGATNINAGNYTDTNTTYLGGTNLTLAGTTFNVDDAFIVNNANDTMTGTLTADGLTLGANENITLGAKTLDHDGTDFNFNDSIDVNDGTHGMRIVPGTSTTSLIFY